MEKNTLIFGPGWLGHKFSQYLGAPLSKADITDKRAVEEALDQHKPEVVINTAGKTGRPNIDWCEDHKIETVTSNITGPLVLARACLDRGIRMAHLSSGCIFDGQAMRPEGFSEIDIPRPVSFYAWTKATADDILSHFPVLILRLRMPVDGTPGPRNLITKLAGYPKIIDAENSVTRVDDLLSATKTLLEKQKTGIYNVTNPGSIKHSDIMSWYQELVDPSHAYQLISTEQLYAEGLTKTGRSNCVLDTRKLESEGIILTSAKQAVRECMESYAKNPIS